MADGGYKCDECSRVMRSRQGYLHHMEMHRNPKPPKPKVNILIFLSPPVHFAQWAHMHHFLSVRPSVCLSVWTGPKITRQ